MKHCRAIVLALLVLRSAFLIYAESAAPWRIEGVGVLWHVDGRVIEPMDISGAASLVSGYGLLVSDETRSVQSFQLDRVSHTIKAGESTTLLSGKGKELDLEAITASSDGRHYYATGSHGVARKSGEVQIDRQHVFRLKFANEQREVKLQSITVSTLVPVIESDTLLRSALGKSSALGGLDIEGLAELNGMLYFGLRSPSIEGRSFIIEVRADDLFADSAKVGHHTFSIPLGEGVGIRDLTRVRDGFVILSGPAGDDKNTHGFALFHWTGPNGRLTKLGELPKSEGKAEGILVLAESETAMDLLVLFDGEQNGGPKSIHLVKPGKP